MSFWAAGLKVTTTLHRVVFSLTHQWRARVRGISAY
jgi:hypothetical protein